VLQPVTGGKIDGPPQLLSQDLGRVADVWARRDGSFIYFRQTGLVSIAIASLDERTSVGHADHRRNGPVRWDYDARMVSRPAASSHIRFP
jgi:hypothetical protein